MSGAWISYMPALCPPEHKAGRLRSLLTEMGGSWNQEKTCGLLGCHRGSHTWESNISLINMLTIRQFNTAGFNISEYLSLWGEKWKKENRERRKWQWHYLNRSIRWAFSCLVRLGYVIWKPQVLSNVWHSTYPTARLSYIPFIMSLALPTRISV